SVGSGDYDMATIKYDPNGTELWVSRRGGMGSAKAFAIALDGAGDVYVAGYSDGGFFFGGFNYATVKYGTNGTKLWAQTYAGAGSIECGGDLDNIWAMAVDGAGDVYVTGESGFCGGWGKAYATIKYTQSPVDKLPPTIVDQPQSLTVVGGGSAQFDVYVSGTSPLNVQWQFNGISLANATNWTLTLTNVQVADEGDYRVVVSNLFGFATSVVAHLTVPL